MQLFKQPGKLTRHALFYLVIFSACTFLGSCKKYLDEKPDQKLAVPSSLNDLELLLNNYDQLNVAYRSIGEVAADNYFLTKSSWSSVTEAHRNFYIWQPYDNIISEWGTPYKAILIDNIILESLPNIKNELSEQARWNNIKGSALFNRAYYFYDMAQYFCAGYDKNTAIQDLGIPLRLTSNTDEVSTRATVEQTYHQILQDLKTAATLLPDTGSVKYHPSKAAAYGTLARVYLIMQDYSNAGLYADSCLRLYGTLMNYNNSPSVYGGSPPASMTNSSANPITRWNEEVIFDAISQSSSALTQTRAKVDTNLQQSYDINDMRTVVFFKRNTDGTWAFKGNYTGIPGAALFRGIATDEMYLTRAECFARAGNTSNALNDLNTLMINRWQNNGTWVPYMTSSADTALNWILNERRKELLFRGIRWSDLRRLNKEQRFAITLTRNLDGQMYQLEPNSLRYVFLIERTVIQQSGMPQNP